MPHALQSLQEVVSGVAEVLSDSPRRKHKFVREEEAVSKAVQAGSNSTHLGSHETVLAQVVDNSSNISCLAVRVPEHAPDVQCNFLQPVPDVGNHDDVGIVTHCARQPCSVTTRGSLARLRGPGHTIFVPVGEAAPVSDFANSILPALEREIERQIATVHRSNDWFIELDYWAHAMSGDSESLLQGLRFDVVVQVRG